MAWCSARITCDQISRVADVTCANCGYMTHTAATGRGVAQRMCEHSLEHARLSGYRAMQFNFVVQH